MTTGKGAPLYCISRIEQGKHQGWWVRMLRDGKVHSQLFSDGRYGPKWVCLNFAQKHRDKWLKSLPPANRGKPPKAEDTARARAEVSKVAPKAKPLRTVKVQTADDCVEGTSYRMLRDPNGKQYQVHVYFARLTLPNGKPAATTRDMGKHGRRKAQRLVRKWLAEKRACS